MQIIIEGQLISQFKKPDYKDKETGEVSIGKDIVQLMTINTLRNGETQNKLVDIPVLPEHSSHYLAKVGDTVQVKCSIMSKEQISFYNGEAV